jgi:hypothetical protein
VIIATLPSEHHNVRLLCIGSKRDAFTMSATLHDDAKNV